MISPDLDKYLTTLANTLDAILGDQSPEARVELIKKMKQVRAFTDEERHQIMKEMDIYVPVTQEEAMGSIRALAREHKLTLFYVIKTERAANFVSIKQKHHRDN